MTDRYESLPAASQLAVLPFLSAVEGYLSNEEPVADLELTIHRVINRDGSVYLQQLTEYFPLREDAKKTSGRVIAVDRGIVGAAYGSRKIYKTRFFDNDTDLINAIDIDEGEKGKKAWLAIPFIGSDESVVLVLYGRCGTRNFFTDERVASVVSMAEGFCRLYDHLDDKPFENLRNFPLQSGRPVLAGASVYKAQQVFEHLPPSFSKLKSFNYETCAA